MCWTSPYSFAFFNIPLKTRSKSLKKQSVLKGPNRKSLKHKAKFLILIVLKGNFVWTKPYSCLEKRGIFLEMLTFLNGCVWKKQGKMIKKTKCSEGTKSLKKQSFSEGAKSLKKKTKCSEGAVLVVLLLYVFKLSTLFYVPIPSLG